MAPTTATHAFVASAPLLLGTRANCIQRRGTPQWSATRLRVRTRPAPPRFHCSASPPDTDTDSGTDTEAVDWPLGPPGSAVRIAPTRWGEGLRGDLARRWPLYRSDWTDGLRFKSISAVLFLYFACLAPVVAFGGITSALTGASMGVVEFLLSSGVTGMLYAVLSGQPLTFVAPTGLTLAFTTSLYGFCGLAGVAFLPTYAWVGIWTALILTIASIANTSDLIKYCTRFTDDIFNSLIATNYLYEASRTLLGAFFVVGANKTTPFIGLTLALGTFLVGQFLVGLRTSRYLFKRARDTLADFGPVLSIAVMSTIASLPALAKFGLERLSIPATFQLAGGRALLVPLTAAPLPVRIAAIVPAILLTCLFFLDQNISTRVVNSPIHRLKKGPGYHLDMLILALCTLLCSVCGLPLMCAGTVQSLAHVQALAQIESRNGKDVIVSVQENRLTAFFTHAGILSSLFLLPIVKRIPMAVISGLFLFLGRNMMKGNDFLARIPYLAMDPKLYPDDAPMNRVSAKQVHAFTALQGACLSMLWVLKLNKKTSMFFPSVIATLMFIRSRIAPRFFSAATLDTLDGDLFEADEDAPEDTSCADRTLSAAN